MNPPPTEVMEIPAASPNEGPRPTGERGVVRLLVVHGTDGATDEGDLEWLTSPKSQVSYHFLIGRSGRVWRLVDPSRRAWHAGASSWQGRSGVNDFSIGYGLSCRANTKPTDVQYRMLARLLNKHRREYKLPLQAIVGHYHVSPGRKTDPWYAFEWGKLFGYMVEEG